MKNNVELIPNALLKVQALRGVSYDWDLTKCNELDFFPEPHDIGVIAQEVQAVLPEVIKTAPFDMDENGNSKSGENYITVQYEKIVPLLIEAIKELQAKVDALQK